MRALGGAARAAGAVSSHMVQGTSSVQPDTQIASAAKTCPTPPLPTDELSSHHKQLITWGIQLANAKSQTLLLGHSKLCMCKPQLL